jgi:hypothetical protein
MSILSKMTFVNLRKHSSHRQTWTASHGKSLEGVLSYEREYSAALCVFGKLLATYDTDAL